MMMKKNLLFVLALLVSMSFIFVSCKDKNDDVVEGAFAADVAGTYVGTMKYPALLSVQMGVTEEPVTITVEKAGDNTVNVSYYGEEETTKKDVSEGDPSEDPDGDDTGDDTGDEMDYEDPDFKNVVVKKEGNKYVFAETTVDFKDPNSGNSIQYVLTGYVIDKKITLSIKLPVGTITAEGTLKEN